MTDVQRASPSLSKQRSPAHEAKRTAILDAALEAFSRYGLHGSRIESIAERAGLSKTNLLYYYPSKQRLYLAVLKRTLDDWLTPLRAFTHDQEPLEAIDYYLQVKLRAARDTPSASRLFCIEMLQGAPVLKPVLERELKELVEEKSEVIAQWVAAEKLVPVDPYQLLYLLWSSTQHYADFAPQIIALSGCNLENPDFFERALKTLRSTVIEGLRPRKA